MSTPFRARGLDLYKRIFRIARSWPEKEQSDYMKQEARRLFKAHKAIKDPSRIEDKLVECEQRIELCLHYRNPYPRLINAVNMTGEQFRAGVTVSSRKIMPGYLSSYYESPDSVESSAPPTLGARLDEEEDDRSSF